MTAIPLKHRVIINARTLPEDTDPDRVIRYIDIGGVGTGLLVDEPKEMTFGAAPSRARRLVRDGDTIVSTVRTYLRAVWPVRGEVDDLVVSTGFAVLSPGPQMDPRFLGWMAQSTPFVDAVVARSVGVSYPAINASDIGSLAVDLPNLEAQREIADYLDTETARIDALIKKKLRLATLVEFREAVLVSRRVQSLVDVHGEIPLRRVVTKVEQGSSPVCDSAPAEAGEWGVLKTSSVSSGRFLPEENKRLPGAAVSDLQWRLRDGDLLMTRGSGSLASVGQAAVARTEGRQLLLSDLIYRLRLREADPDFLAIMLRSPQVREQIQGSIRSDAGQTLKLRGDDIRELRIPAVPSGQQHDEYVSLQRNMRQHQLVRRRLDEQVGLLREHRQALITAAVTGQLEIPGAA